MDSIGFSDHAPLPFPTSWAMKEEGIGDYLKEVVDAKIKFDKSLKVYCGFEADFIKGGVTPDRWRVLPGLDYMIGSIHFLLMPDGQLLEVTGDRQNFELIRNQNNLEDKELMLLYFQANADMLEDANVDVLGHLDKMKINIPNFNEILASDKDVQKVLDSVLHLCDREDVVHRSEHPRSVQVELEGKLSRAIHLESNFRRGTEHFASVPTLMALMNRECCLMRRRRC